MLCIFKNILLNAFYEHKMIIYFLKHHYASVNYKILSDFQIKNFTFESQPQLTAKTSFLDGL